LPRLEVPIPTNPVNEIDHFSLYDIGAIDMNKMAAVLNNDATTASTSKRLPHEGHVKRGYR
jgi:hypothetical protein